MANVFVDLKLALLYNEAATLYEEWLNSAQFGSTLMVISFSALQDAPERGDQN